MVKVTGKSAFVFFFTVVFAAIHMPLPGWAKKLPDRDRVASAPNEYIVKLRPTFKSLSAIHVNNLLSSSASKSITTDGDTFLITRSGEQDSVLSELTKINAVEYAEPNYRYRILAVPDDAEYGKLWGLANTGQLVKLDSKVSP